MRLNINAIKNKRKIKKSRILQRLKTNSNPEIANFAAWLFIREDYKTEYNWIIKELLINFMNFILLNL